MPHLAAAWSGCVAIQFEYRLNCPDSVSIEANDLSYSASLVDSAIGKSSGTPLCWRVGSPASVVAVPLLPQMPSTGSWLAK